MRWGERPEEKAARLRVSRERLEKWHRWFAWRPVRLDTGYWVWMETVARRLTRGRDGYIPIYSETWRLK